MPFITNSSSHFSPPSPEQAAASETHVEIPAPRADLDDAPFWREVEAFNLLPQPMIDEYYGQYVAVYDGNIVDADPDEGELALRFYRTFGYVPVYIHKVGVEDGLVDCDDR
jgi:hypothetical protein